MSISAFCAFQGDGRVAWPSAYLDHPASEFIVGNFHFQDTPPTIEEVRRFLLEHLSALPDQGSRATPAESSPNRHPFAKAPC